MRQIPEDNLSYPVLLTIGESTGTGFFLNTDTGTLLITAKHVLYNPQSGVQYGAHAKVTSYPKEHADTEERCQGDVCKFEETLTSIALTPQSEFGEVGAVYQAANAIYLGLTNPKDQSNYIMEGVWLSGWDVRKKYGTRSFEELKKIDPEVKEFPLSPKYKYLFIKAATSVKSKIHSCFDEYKLPYPKKMTEKVRKFD